MRADRERRWWVLALAWIGALVVAYGLWAGLLWLLFWIGT